MIGFACGLLAMVLVLAMTKIDFTWHTVIGSLVTILMGNLSWAVRSPWVTDSS